MSPKMRHNENDKKCLNLFNVQVILELPYDKLYLGQSGQMVARGVPSEEVVIHRSSGRTSGRGQSNSENLGQYGHVIIFQYEFIINSMFYL